MSKKGLLYLYRALNTNNLMLQSDYTVNGIESLKGKTGLLYFNLDFKFCFSLYSGHY